MHRVTPAFVYNGRRTQGNPENIRNQGEIGRLSYPKCQKEYISMKPFETHLRQHDQEEENTRDSARQSARPPTPQILSLRDAESGRFHCPHCPQVYRYQASFRKHLSQHGSTHNVNDPPRCRHPLLRIKPITTHGTEPPTTPPNGSRYANKQQPGLRSLTPKAPKPILHPHRFSDADLPESQTSGT
jgi:hypothetical protein